MTEYESPKVGRTLLSCESVMAASEVKFSSTVNTVGQEVEDFDIDSFDTEWK